MDVRCLGVWLVLGPPGAGRGRPVCGAGRHAGLAAAAPAASQSGLQADFVKVTDMKAILAYDLMSTPGLVVNNKRVSSGRIPAVAEVQKWLCQPGSGPVSP